MWKTYHGTSIYSLHKQNCSLRHMQINFMKYWITICLGSLNQIKG